MDTIIQYGGLYAVASILTAKFVSMLAVLLPIRTVLAITPLLFNPVVEELLKRALGKRMAPYFSATFMVVETIAYAKMAGIAWVSTVALRCVITHPMHLTASKMRFSSGVLFHAGFNVVALACKGDFPVLGIILYVVVGTVLAFRMK